MDRLLLAERSHAAVRSLTFALEELGAAERELSLAQAGTWVSVAAGRYRLLLGSQIAQVRAAAAPVQFALDSSAHARRLAQFVV